MNNETQPTPEQLAKWREEFEAQLLPATEMTRDVFGTYCLNGLERQWQGYLRAKQESEQAMKLAKFGAMALSSEILMYHSHETITDAIACGLLVEDAHQGDTIYGVGYAPNIEATIKELLNEQ